MSKKKDKIQKRTTYQPKEEEEETVKEKVYPAFEIPDFAAHLNLFFPLLILLLSLVRVHRIFTIPFIINS